MNLDSSSDESSSDESSSDDENDEAEEYYTNPNEEAPLGRIRRKQDEFQQDVIQLPLAYFLETDEEDERNAFYTRQTSSNAEKGFEILNNIQIFFPGDRFYNQFQEFDDESTDFDAYCLGPLKAVSYTHLTLPTNSWG